MPLHFVKSAPIERLIRFALLISSSILIWLLWSNYPTHYSFIPPCQFYETFGVQCPGCGGLRASHFILHGQLKNAIHYNLFVVIATPFFAFFYLNSMILTISGYILRFKGYQYIYLFILTMFFLCGTFRNL
jgi:hypothetical protein